MNRPQKDYGLDKSLKNHKYIFMVQRYENKELMSNSGDVAKELGIGVTVKWTGWSIEVKISKKKKNLAAFATKDIL